jgi:NitT/TauT family transport system permease protein
VPTSERATPRRRRALWTALGSLLLLGAWQAASLGFPALILPSVPETVEALLGMAMSGELWRRLATTLWRMALGWVIGSVVGILLGLVAGRFEPVYDALRPTQSLLLGVPPVVLVVVAMIWFGSGSLVPIVVVSVLIFPIVYVNTAQGWRSLDLRLVEMARIYGKGSGEVLRHVILPGLAVPIFTGLSVSAGFAVRISVMAELLASDSGIGYSIALARVNINTAKVFAWALVSVVLVAVIDVLIVNPLKRRALRWQG